MKTSRYIIVIMVLLFMAAAVICLADHHSGAPNITLDGGKRGNIPFPHERHQLKLGEESCQLCHDRFPQEPGAIAKLIAGGELKKKKVMNILCVKCHKQRKRAGRDTGPIKCSACHIKQKK